MKETAKGSVKKETAKGVFLPEGTEEGESAMVAGESAGEAAAKFQMD